MTRESFNGTVTFWESTTGAKFHLSERWAGDHTRGDKTRKRIEERWKSRPARYDLLTPEGKKAWKKDTAKRQGMNRHELLKSMTDLTSLPISPWKQLYDSESLVVVPYESIEIVFNGSQVWGNLGNHHPACIYYDMEDDSRSWLPLISGDGEKELQVGKAVAIPVGPPMSKHTCQELEDSIEMEIEESVRMIRMRQGKDSSFTGNRKSADAGTMSEEADLLQDCLEKYVELLEAEMKLEADWCYDDGDRLRKPWGPTSPLNTQTYMQQCRVEWSKYWKKKDALKKARSYLPVKDNHVLSGIPFHISSTDLKVIRKDLMECRALQEYFSLDMEEAPFFTVVKVFPMPSSVLSVWIFFGAEVPMSKERVLELATAKVKKILDKDPDASSESEEDEKARRERKRKRKKGAWAKDEIKG
ncbi:unnamed protein product [Prorocentrum cordatum]|uniref:Centrosomal protein of 76 kDa C-terminal domain-containing protein n=1 Tax=Prorocentrum cordatum TaxID=2364126 RepID=A0ABN9QVQ7_9DINO|nr:unnamed protein product [Polarella glacialis]